MRSFPAWWGPWVTRHNVQTRLSGRYLSLMGPAYSVTHLHTHPLHSCLANNMSQLYTSSTVRPQAADTAAASTRRHTQEGLLFESHSLHQATGVPTHGWGRQPQPTPCMCCMAPLAAATPTAATPNKPAASQASSLAMRHSSTTLAACRHQQQPQPSAAWKQETPETGRGPAELVAAPLRSKGAQQHQTAYLLNHSCFQAHCPLLWPHLAMNTGGKGRTSDAGPRGATMPARNGVLTGNRAYLPTRMQAAMTA